ncbi:hypothetical protein OJF2_51080 [Aquisphaera giovannonii]|uniref:Uncharacterized protein n=1 Tax=Aquisphaera giovannonii TaxID=406548 RepID=A0A5B9W8F8_9BACT|nr:hypothetical protein [Aquisphaera giovannonii]QEH36524.1 hypothetical protein OJF2_51080 [Aquisphaera giovannonii]
MTQDQADQSLGKIIRGAIAKAMPLDYSSAVQLYLTVDLEGFGVVLIKVEVLGTQHAARH